MNNTNYDLIFHNIEWSAQIVHLVVQKKKNHHLLYQLII